MRKLKLFFACLLMAVLSIGQVWATDYQLVTSTDDLEAGANYVIGSSASGSGVFMSTAERSNNRGVTSSITITDGKITGTNELLVVELGGESGAWTFLTTNYTENGYLTSAATGKNNHCKVVTPVENCSYFTIAFNGDAATITSTGRDERNILRYNSSNNPPIFACYSSGQNDIYLFKEVASGGGDTPTLTSIAVSGTPTKTSYYAGDNFDPAGLTVTGTYSDASHAAITSGITWSYNPSQTLAANQTSIGVTATVGEISSDEVNVTVTVTVPTVSNWQVIAPENLATGDVVVLTMNVGGTYYAASNNNGTSNPPSATSVAVTGSNLSATPATTLQWTVTVVSEGVFQFAVGDKKMYCTDTNNGVRVGTDPTSGTFCNTFDIYTATDSKLYLHTTESMPDAENGRYVGVYNAQNWRCYTSINNNIKGGSLVIFKEFDSRAAADLNFETKQYLIKKNAEFTAPELVNPNSLSVSYTSSNENVAEVAANGAITIKADATGAATITASFDGDETYKDGSASYTIFVAEKAGTNVEGEILTEAIAKELIDLGCTLPVYVTGTIQTPQYFDQSKTYTVTLTDGFQFYYFYAGPNEATFDQNILTAGDVLVAYGNLKKSGNYYRLNPCYMVSREPYSEPKVDISNDEATAYTPAKAIELYNDITSDLTKTVYVKGVVVASPAIKYNSDLTDAAAVYNGTYNVYVKAENDDSENPTKFEFFRMYADENNSTFEEGDIQDGDVIVAKGILSKYSNTYEFAQGCQMVSKKSKATMTFDDLEMVVNDEEALAPKTITLATAEAVTYAIKEGSDDCITLANGVVTATAEGTATIVATVATVEAYIGTSVEFTVTVSAAAPVLTNYYEKVTATENITDGTYLIVYENGNVAFNGGLGTLDAEGNTIDVEITNDHKIGVTSATEAATFFIDVTAGSIQAASGDYIGVSSYGNGLKQSETSDYSHTFAIDGEGNAIIGIYGATWNKGGEGTMILRYNSASGQTRFRYYKEGGQQPIALYKLANETVKANPELAWSGDVEITLGDDFTAPTLSHADGFTGTITYSSDNEELATVNDNGVISLLADATGTAVITASFAGNDDYKAASVSCTIIVNASAPTPAETKNVVILAEYNSKFYAMTTTLNNKAFKAVEVEKDGDKIVVFAEADKSAIQWTMTANTTTATFQDADDKYLAHTGTGTDLTLQAGAEDWTWDSENGYYYAVANRTFFYNNSGVFKNYSISNLPADKTDYSGAPEIIEIAAEDIILSEKVDPQLAFDPEEVTLTVGDAFVAPVLGYVEGFDGLADVTLESSNTNLAVVNEGVVSLVEDAIGTATITATFAGNNNYLAGSASYVIIVNEAGDDLTGTWVLASSVAAGDKFIVAGTYNNETKTMGKQNSNPNRAAVASSVDEWNVLTPGEGTKVFTLVDAGGNKFAIQASNGKYLSATGTGTKNYLAEAEDFEADNAKWTINIENGLASVVASSNNRNKLQYNKSGDGLFSCYDGNQTAIQIFKIGTPDYGSYQRNVTSGNFGTICLPQAGTIEGVTLFEIGSYENNIIYVDEVIGSVMEAGKPYIFQATADQLNVTYTSGAQVAATDVNGLYGFYNLSNMATDEADKLDLDEDQGNYILYNNQYWLVSGRAAYINNFRAYIKIGEIENTPAPDPTPGQAPRRRVAMTVHGEQTATGIGDLNASETPVKMIIDGQLFIIRGEKMYNANGQLVK